MQPATASTVLGDFSNATFTGRPQASMLFQRDGTYLARTDGPDGALHEYEIRYTFGVAPLQQYLVPLGGGRLQGLALAWDSRAKQDGGQRWFDLYPDVTDHNDPLHWTGAAENWNYMCADCHSTNVRKAYSAQTSSYATSFAEMSVACEACHGPGSLHVAWARVPEPVRPRDADGLAVALDERTGVTWQRDAATGKPTRSQPRSTEREIQTCARCHARRGLVHEDSVHGQPVGDDYDVALLDDDLYYPDGQIKAEVYEYGSFVQSRMYAAGVTCSDCHDPHSGKPRAPGDGLCLQCHSPQAYATPKHHFHGQASPGARCVSCHMPSTTYMIVDARRDHSLRVPRPALSVTLGVPNPCNGCHADRTAAWAARTVEAWYGHAPSGLQQFAGALAAGSRGEPGAERLLVELVADRSQPAIARASALARLGGPVTPAALAALRAGLGDASFLIRGAAIRALASADPRVRAPLVAPLLADPVRSVRLAAVAALADVPSDALSSPQREAFARASAELVSTEELNGDRPEAHVALATFRAGQRQLDVAETELERALVLAPAFTPASVNLADLYRVVGRDADGERVLREALSRAPNDPSLHHALGLALVREHRLDDAIAELGDAARAGPDNPRHGYVYAVALHDAGRTHDALGALEDVVRRHPYDRDALAALVAFDREAGRLDDALSRAEQLAKLDPDSQIQSVLDELRAATAKDAARSQSRASP